MYYTPKHIIAPEAGSGGHLRSAADIITTNPPRTEIHYRYPRNSADAFYQQFSDPARAFWNMEAAYERYKTDASLPYPNSDLDHINYAWRDAHGEL
jgi:hypothetical protein